MFNSQTDRQTEKRTILLIFYLYYLIKRRLDIFPYSSSLFNPKRHLSKEYIKLAQNAFVHFSTCKALTEFVDKKIPLLYTLIIVEMIQVLKRYPKTNFIFCRYQS